MLFWFLNPASFESNDQAERIQILFQGAFIVRTTSTFVRMQHNKHKLMKQLWMAWSVCPVSFWLPSFSALAPGAYRQVPAPRTQRSGPEKLHEHSGESGTERWAPCLFFSSFKSFCLKASLLCVDKSVIFPLWAVLTPHMHTDTHTCVVHWYTQNTYIQFISHEERCEVHSTLCITEGIPSLNTSRAKIKPSCFLVCTTGEEMSPYCIFRRPGSEIRAAVTWWKTLTVTRLFCKPQCKLSVPFVKQRFRLFRWLKPVGPIMWV